MKRRAASWFSMTRSCLVGYFVNINSFSFFFFSAKKLQKKICNVVNVSVAGVLKTHGAYCAAASTFPTAIVLFSPKTLDVVLATAGDLRLAVDATYQQASDSRVKVVYVVTQLPLLDDRVVVLFAGKY